MTVNILIQIDKLVQLLESPVFTCTLYQPPISALTNKTHARPPAPTPRTREIPAPLQMPLRAAHAPPAILGLCRAEEPPQQRQLDRIPPHRAKTVCCPALMLPCLSPLAVQTTAKVLWSGLLPLYLNPKPVICVINRQKLYLYRLPLTPSCVLRPLAARRHPDRPASTGRIGSRAARTES